MSFSFDDLFSHRYNERKEIFDSIYSGEFGSVEPDPEQSAINSAIEAAGYVPEKYPDLSLIQKIGQDFFGLRSSSLNATLANVDNSNRSVYNSIAAADQANKITFDREDSSLKRYIKQLTDNGFNARAILMNGFGGSLSSGSSATVASVPSSVRSSSSPGVSASAIIQLLSLAASVILASKGMLPTFNSGRAMYGLAGLLTALNKSGLASAASPDDALLAQAKANLSAAIAARNGHI